MAGIDNITGEILLDARKQADSILTEAREKAGILKADAAKEAEAVKAKALQKAAAEAAEYERRIQSQIDMQRRQAILAGKQEIIAEVIARAQEKLRKQDDASWLAMLEKLLANNVQAGDGEIIFSEEDKKRLSSDVAELVSRAAAEKGGTLKMSEETADIADGFVLRYGGIDENCSLKALFDEKQEQLQDVVHQLLW